MPTQCTAPQIELWTCRDMEASELAVLEGFALDVGLEKSVHSR